MFCAASTIRDNGKVILLYQQTAKKVQNFFKDLAAFEMNYEKFKQLCTLKWIDCKKKKTIAVVLKAKKN